MLHFRGLETRAEEAVAGGTWVAEPAHGFSLTLRDALVLIEDVVQVGDG